MIDFLRYRPVVLISSLIAFFSFLALGIYKRYVSPAGSAFNYSIDFTGGTQVLLRFEKPISSSTVRDALEQGGWTGAVIREFPNNETLVRVQEFVNDPKGLAEKIAKSIVEKIPDNQATILQSESVGAGIGSELRWKAFMAVSVSLIVLLFYIALAFWSIPFGVGAVVALAHDALVMLAFFMLFNRDISIIAIGAILAILGYSINDTIVIFSKIRSNFKAMRNHTVREIVNTSINQTLRRTIFTSFATMIAVIPMFLIGGEALRDFSITLLLGVIFGTYSSIFIASPVMMLFYGETRKS